MSECPPRRLAPSSALSPEFHPAPRLVGTDRDQDEDGDRCVHQHEEVDLVDVAEVDQLRDGLSAASHHQCDPGPGAVGEQEDRKSTRLNSSHANISYAVFCLKKKKKS